MLDSKTCAWLNDQQARLAAHLEALWAQRQEPCYLLEALGCGLEPGELSGAVTTAVRVHQPSSRWWRARALPLLVLLADVGYGYRGPQTEFWESAERRLDVPLPQSERTALSHLHEREAADPRRPLARPPSSEWARHFHHIAWPITHAVLPLDLQRALVEALASLPVPLTRDLAPGELAGLLRRFQGAHAGARFEQWLESEDLVRAVTCTLLGADDETLIDGSLLRRIRADLSRDHQAQLDLELALLTQARLHEAERAPREPGQQPRRPRLATLFLQLPPPPEPPRLGVVLPPLTPGASAVAGLGGQTSSVLGATPPLRLRSAFSGMPILLDLSALPESDAPAFAEEDLQGLPGPLRAEVAATTIRCAPRLVFGWDGEAAGDDRCSIFRQVHDRGSNGERLVVLVHGGQPPTPAGLRELPELILGCRALLVDSATDEVWDWLFASEGAAPPVEPPAWVGGPQDGGAGQPLLHRDDPCAWLVPASTTLRVADAATSLSTRQRSIVMLSGASERTGVLVATDSGELEVRPVEYGPPLPCALSTTGPLTLEALMQGDLTIWALGPSQLSELRAVVELVDEDGASLATADQVLEDLPRALDLEALRGSLRPADVDLTVTAEVAGVARERWRLRRLSSALRPLVAPELPVGELQHAPEQVLVAGGTQPWRLAPEAGLETPEVVTLSVAEDDHGNLSGGRCLATPTAAGPWPGPRRPGLTGALESSPRKVGLRDLVRAFAAWSLAECTSKEAERHQRTVLRALDALITESSCGQDWRREEARTLPRDAWEALTAAWRHYSKVYSEVSGVHKEVAAPETEAIEASRSLIPGSFSGRLTDLSRAISSYKRTTNSDDTKRRQGPVEELKVQDELRTAAPQLEHALSDPNPVLSPALADSAVPVLYHAFGDVAVRGRRVTWRPLKWSELVWSARRMLSPSQDYPQLSSLRALISVLGPVEELDDLDRSAAKLEVVAFRLRRWSRRNLSALVSEAWSEQQILSVLRLWCSPQDLGHSWGEVTKLLAGTSYMTRVCRYVSLRRNLIRRDRA